ncbi:hypothetical protein MTR_5g063660 [Medicago truncatula]|uniref:Uncharacterized protein n=1 Tax=Medicago truncatula TaxID=3880 RepID=G7KB72_MEDTR|nr:hypothetical protein MTR_5g063660 [Medicago truncatula]
MDKLLEFCSDDQRLQIILKLTKEPNQLVRTSLNTHGLYMMLQQSSPWKTVKKSWLKKFANMGSLHAALVEAINKTLVPSPSPPYCRL